MPTRWSRSGSRSAQYDAARPVPGEVHVDLLTTGDPAGGRALHLDLADDALALCDDVVTSAVNVGPEDVDALPASQPAILEQLGEEEILDELLAIAREGRVTEERDGPRADGGLQLWFGHGDRDLPQPMQSRPGTNSS